MPTTAEFTIGARDFPLGTSFAGVDGVRVELEKIVPTTRTVVPYLWVRGVSAEAVETALDAHSATQEVTPVESVADRHLLRVDWNPGYEGFLTIMSETEVVLLSARGDDAEWTFVIRGDDHAAIGRFQTACREADVPIDLVSLQESSGRDRETTYGLTDAQREALLLTYERGYFDSPRATSLEDVAAELGISRQALSSRLRRGHRQLLETTLAGP